MSGGYFDYRQYHIGEIADSIEREIESATGPRPPLVEKEGVSACRMESENCGVYLNCRFHTFGAALKEFTNPNDFEVLERGENFVKVKGMFDGYVYVVRHFTYTEYEDGECYPDYTDETLNEFRNAIYILKKAEIYAQRVDWLISCDDGEESFHERLRKELEELDMKYSNMDRGNAL